MRSLGLQNDLNQDASSKTDGKSIVIGLLDHMGYGNLGDAAVQESVIANIQKRLPKARLVGFSLIPEDTTRRHGIPCHPILRWHPTLQRTGGPSASSIPAKPTLKSRLKSTSIVYLWAKPSLEFMREIGSWVHSYLALRKLDLLIISGGGQLSELWRGPWSHPYTIFKFCLLVKIARKKLFFLNVGAGPLKHPLSRFFAKSAVQWADYRSFRDHDSQQLIRSLGVKSVMHVYPDPAYALDTGDYVRSAPSSNRTPIVGLNPIGFCAPRFWYREDEALYQKYLDKIARFSTWLLQHGYDLRLFTNEVSVDLQAIDDLRSRLLLSVSPDLVSRVFLDPSRDVKDVLEEMSHFDFVVTSKFHGVIFSQLLRKPVIALSYHRKMDVAMGSIGQSRFCADIERFDAAWLISAFRLLEEESATIKLASAAVAEARAAQLSEQFDELFLNYAKRRSDVMAA